MPDSTTTESPARPAALDQEYVVAGGLWGWRGKQARGLALPWAFDDVTQDFGDDLYDRMEHDAQIAACDTLLTAAILEDGIALSPAVDDRDADGYQQSAELVDFCEAQLEDLDTALDDVLWDMLGCLGRGSRVAEITYHPLDASPLPGRAVLQSITVKPRRSTAFVVDAYMRLIGLVGQQVDRWIVQAGALIDPSDPRVLPREKFAIASFRPRNNDPRGRSAWRPAYNPWWLKMQTWQEYLKYLAQFASGTVVGKTAPGATQKTTDPSTGEVLSPVQRLLRDLVAIQNGSAIAVPAGTDIQILFSQGEGRAFLSAFQLYNAEITKSITTQTLASNEGDTASRAQASVHQDALGTIVRQAKRSQCRMLRRDVLRHLVRYNYGDKLLPLVPKVSLGEVEAEDIAKLIAAFAQLQTSGYLHPSQLAGTDKMLNLPPRTITPEEQQSPAPAQNPPPDNQPPAPGQLPGGTP